MNTLPPHLPEQGSLDGSGETGPAARAGVLVRAVVGLAGLAALVAASMFTMGGAFVATVGMLVASAVATRRKRPLTRRATWIGAVMATGVAILVVTAVTVSAMPAGSLAQLRRGIDSSSAAGRNTPPPAWLDRIAPEAAARSRAQQVRLGPTFSRAVELWTAAMGTVLLVVFFSVIIGTLGWGAGLLLAFAFTGRWISGAGTLPHPA